ncbi:MAG: NAD(P)-dependent oxidoreductase [Chitinophagaceae bacterium]|nr:NAD(P)-dependent oxidoreductase [Chitinophagaceae bacterium]
MQNGISELESPSIGGDWGGRTVFITGASRGIGKAIGLRLAKEGANIVVAAKSVEENPKLGGTIFSAAQEIEQAGGKALAVQCDIRFEDQIKNAVDKAVETFSGIDILINNASAINLTPAEQISPKQFDLMHDINVRGTFFVSQACIPHLKKSENPHILTLSPPINLAIKWFGDHVAYTMAKYNMTMIALGLAEELKKHKIASNALWPKTTIATAAVKNLLGGDTLIKMSRQPEIIADAVYYILSKPSTECTGHTFIDEEVLALEGITDLSEYSVVPGGKLYTDLFL